jgi:16S rRNA (cytidine1402-2'-O)-methyltransferase
MMEGGRSAYPAHREVMMAGRLVLAGTPIGDSRDASPALCEALAGAEIIAAEDTRRLRTLLARLGVTTRAEVVSYFEGNEEARTPGLVRSMRDGRSVLLVTDAGMPCVSDPGYRLVRACVDAGVTVSALPGPSAVLTALAVSGLPVDRFCFEGFLPRKDAARASRLARLADEPRTMVFYEAPHRLAAMLHGLSDAFGADRAAAVCRELTKPYEEVIRDSLGALACWADEGVRGEITVVVAGADPQTLAAAALDTALELARARVAGGAALSLAVADVAATTGVNRRELYQAAIAARSSDGAWL